MKQDLLWLIPLVVVAFGNMVLALDHLRLTLSSKQPAPPPAPAEKKKP